MMLAPQMNDPAPALRITRRHLLGGAGAGIGALGLGSLLDSRLLAGGVEKHGTLGGLPELPHFAPKAARVIYLFQSGGPSQLDLFAPKPGLLKLFGKEVPRSVYPDARKTTMTSAQESFATAPSRFRFERHGDGGTRISELLPHTAKVANEICVVRSMYTEAINHDPAITFFQTGSQIPGRPSIGAWLTYGLGAETHELPSFVAMSSRGSGRAGQPIYDRLWGSGFLPSHYQGVKFRNQGDPVLDISNPPGVDRELRREMIDFVTTLNRKRLGETGDPEIATRIAAYELAYRMQMSVPDLTDLSDETASTFELYGKAARRPGNYAYNCLLARRLAERGVRFIQLFHQGWDQHGNLPKQIRGQCVDTDQPTAGLIRDLKQRGMLDDTLIVWGGEFGRTVYSQGKLTKKSYGRDHHPSCFSMWLAGGGVRGGMTHGTTDDYSVNVANDGVHVHDLQATILHLLGIDHERLTYEFQGRDYRLTDVHGRVVRELLA